MARKRRVALPADVVSHQPVIFDDSIDLPEVPEGVTPPARVPLLPALPALPQLQVRRGVYLESSRRGLGRSAQAKPVRRTVRATVDVSRIVRIGVPFNAKQIGVQRGRSLFNKLAIPFSKRADVCVKRKQRREVIFAKKYNGRNGGKVYRRTYVSQYAC